MSNIIVITGQIKKITQGYVHRRVRYLAALIESLSQAAHIEDTLLIFSHDFYDEHINQLIAQITFCPVMQIFFPNSTQLYPDVFPGTDPRDCPQDTPKQGAMQKKCPNAEWPDLYGHYREARFTQIKHHWFWKLNHVFGSLAMTQTYNGPVLLLEEDHYVIEDFIHTLHSIFTLRDKVCPECHLFALADYYQLMKFGERRRLVEVINWASTRHGWGMAIDRVTWEQIGACAEMFCEYDDYNWDWTIQHLGASCEHFSGKVLSVLSPRVLHIGDCGVHYNSSDCDPGEKLASLNTLLSANRDSLYPKVFQPPISMKRRLQWNGSKKKPSQPQPNGGWADHRDHQLCHSFTPAWSHGERRRGEGQGLTHQDDTAT